MLRYALQYTLRYAKVIEKTGSYIFLAAAVVFFGSTSFLGLALRLAFGGSILALSVASKRTRGRKDEC